MKKSSNVSSLPEGDLIPLAVSGDRTALEEIIVRYQTWIFNLALSFVADRDHAADLTQEVLIKIVTKLSTFNGDSSFKTWVYRIVKNHFLNMKRQKYEVYSMTFDSFAQDLVDIRDEPLTGYASDTESEYIVKEAKLSCMKAMLLCFDREQRLIFILGELFEFPDIVGAEIMEMSKENFRVRLHRARQQLYNFMDNKCGLINKKNPCRCVNKTRGFIRLGFVDPVSLHFQRDAVDSIEKTVEKKVETYSSEITSQYQKLYMDHPFLKGPETLDSIRTLLSSSEMKDTFDLN